MKPFFLGLLVLGVTLSSLALADTIKYPATKVKITDTEGKAVPNAKLVFYATHRTCPFWSANCSTKIIRELNLKTDRSGFVQIPETVFNLKSNDESPQILIQFTGIDMPGYEKCISQLQFISHRATSRNVLRYFETRNYRVRNLCHITALDEEIKDLPSGLITCELYGYSSYSNEKTLAEGIRDFKKWCDGNRNR